jgi:hypothetical protein
MRSEFTDKTTIFRNDYQGKVFYSATISKKDKDGEWQNTTIGIQFPKSVDLKDKTKINIEKAWLTFYLKEKKPVFYIMCTEFEILEQGKDGIPEGFAALEDDDIPAFLK